MKEFESCSIIDIDTEKEILKIHGENKIRLILSRNIFAVDNMNFYIIKESTYFNHSGHTVILVKRRPSIFDKVKDIK